MRACDWFRQQAEANRDALLEVQEELHTRGIERSLTRILDALLWSVHPASAASHWGTLRFTPDLTSVGAR